MWLLVLRHQGSCLVDAASRADTAQRGDQIGGACRIGKLPVATCPSQSCAAAATGAFLLLCKEPSALRMGVRGLLVVILLLVGCALAIEQEDDVYVLTTDAFDDFVDSEDVYTSQSLLCLFRSFSSFAIDFFSRILCSMVWTLQELSTRYELSQKKRRKTC